MNVNGIEFTLTRKRVKNINLRVKAPDGAVEVSAPFLMPEAAVKRFVASRESWIREKQEQIVQRSADITREPSKEDLARLKEEIPQRIAEWESVTGLHPAGWRLRKMKSCWGTCNTKTGILTFNSRLAFKSPEFRNYVVLHEMAHLREASHGERFKAMLDLYMPEWRKIRKES